MALAWKTLHIGCDNDAIRTNDPEHRSDRMIMVETQACSRLAFSITGSDNV